jgi:NAD(P)-dependent dehydrogenase (short-subunit alcohol dehydrogenase family)
MGQVRDFRGKVVVITGGGGGLGRALAQEFSSKGATVCILDIDSNGLSETKKLIEGKGGKIFPYFCDVSEKTRVFSTFDKIRSEAGPVYCLVNNAGITHFGAFYKTKVEVLEKVIAINLLGAIYCTRAAVKDIIAQKGIVIGICSVAGFAPLVGRCAYVASKHGLSGFLNTLRTELLHFGVSVLNVYPTYIRTGIDKHALTSDGSLNVRPRTPSGDVLEPEEAASEIVRAAEENRRILLLGKTAEIAWNLYRENPEKYEKTMLELNRYILEEY